MTEERLRMINQVNENMKYIAEVIKKMEEGYSFDIRLKGVRTPDSFSVIPFISESQRGVIEALINRSIRENLENYKKEFEKL